MTGERTTGERMTGERMTGERMTGERMTGEPMTGEPRAGEPRAGEPRAGELVTAGPMTAEPGGGRRRRRRTRVAVLGAVTALAAAGGLLAVTRAGAGGDDTDQAATALPPATAEVSRQDLVQTQQADGTLGYGDTREIASGMPGVVTWLPAEGSTVTRGEALYRLDNGPVVLLYGDLPPYRTLKVGVDAGPDVRGLEENLAALGHTGFSVDDEYTAGTADAVSAWQSDLGLPETGVVEPGRVVVDAGPVRVSEAQADLGGRTAAGQPILATTGTARVVTVDLDVADQALARRGGAVTVELPGGSTVKGTVTRVGTVAQSAEEDTGADSAAAAGESTPDATIEVTVSLRDPKAAGTLDQAPVSVEFVSEERRDVLAVPVAALLALRDGGYGLEVVTGGTTRIVAVEVGMFANGRVEVRGPGIAAGTKVGVPPA
jgi:membrane fusion protein, multidrug efflux system